MVAGLANKCPQLQELSLKDSEKVTDRQVPEIRRCLRLSSLNISGTSVTGGPARRSAAASFAPTATMGAPPSNCCPLWYGLMWNWKSKLDNIILFPGSIAFLLSCQINCSLCYKNFVARHGDMIVGK